MHIHAKLTIGEAEDMLRNIIKGDTIAPNLLPSDGDTLAVEIRAPSVELSYTLDSETARKFKIPLIKMLREFVSDYNQSMGHTEPVENVPGQTRVKSVGLGYTKTWVEKHFNI